MQYRAFMSINRWLIERRNADSEVTNNSRCKRNICIVYSIPSDQKPEWRFIFDLLELFLDLMYQRQFCSDGFYCFTYQWLYKDPWIASQRCLLESRCTNRFIAEFGCHTCFPLMLGGCQFWSPNSCSRLGRSCLLVEILSTATTSSTAIIHNGVSRTTWKVIFKSLGTSVLTTRLRKNYGQQLSAMLPQDTVSFSRNEISQRCHEPHSFLAHETTDENVNAGLLSTSVVFFSW
jgi:hypothetical protein